MSVTRTVAPTEMAVNLEEALRYLRVNGIVDLEQDGLRLLERATQYAEEYQWTQLITATFVERWDSFPCVIKPSKNPLLTVTSLAYVDTSGVTQTLVVDTDYTVDIYTKPGRIVPAYGKAWPATRSHINGVTLTYTAGYGPSYTYVPENVRQAILMLAVHWNEFHGVQDGVGSPVQMSVKALLDLNSFREFY